MIESRTDQPRTRPVAFLRNSVGVSPIDSVAIFTSQLMGCQGPLTARLGDPPQAETSAAPSRQLSSALAASPARSAPPGPPRAGPGLAVHEDVLGDLSLLGVQVDHRALEYPIAVDAAGVDGQRPVHPLDAPALVDVAMH